jgi:hypothetical protein
MVFVFVLGSHERLVNLGRNAMIYLSTTVTERKLKLPFNGIKFNSNKV